MFYTYHNTLYVPPHISASDYEILFDALESLYYLYESYLLVIGDFNVPNYVGMHISVSDWKVLSVQNFSNFYNLTQYNTIKNCNNKILDLVLTNLNCEVSKALDTFILEDAYHPALMIHMFCTDNLMNFPVISNNDHNFRKANFPNLYSDLMLINWSFLSKIEDINVMVEEFYFKLYFLFQKHVPKKKPLLASILFGLINT